MRTSFNLFFILFFYFSSTAQTVQFDFEDGNLSSWTQSTLGRWEVSTLSPLGGTRSLKHAPTSGTDVDRISFPLPAWDGAQGTITWRFRLRHRFAPSSTNHWAVFLSSDLDASGMVTAPTSIPNGYAIGVNLTGSDDLLKLYVVTNGVFTPILSTTLNWETQVGTALASISAVEVVRKNDGTFTVNASTVGSFSNLVNLGSVNSTTHSFGGHFGFYYRYTTSAAGLLMADDISIFFKPVNTNNFDATVGNPALQFPSGSISSLATSSAQAVNMFRFRITDGGANDGLPTYPRKLVFWKSSGASAAPWPEVIGGVVLKNQLNQSIPTTNTTVQPNFIEIEIEKEAMPVADGENEEFTLALFIKGGSITHGQTIQINVPTENHGWEGDLSGTEFAEQFSESTTSNIFSIEVIPTHVFFQTYPQQVVVNSPFAISAYAADSQGNRATSYDGLMELQLAQGQGLLSFDNGSISGCTDGLATWEGVRYSGRDAFAIRAIGQGLTGATGTVITVANDNTTAAIAPSTQPTGSGISSLITAPGQALEVLRFIISDPGTNDGEATHVSQITIKRSTGTDLASFSRNIAGVAIRRNGSLIPIGNPSIGTSSITIPLQMGALSIADATQAELSLGVYLRTTGLEDGKNLAFTIDQNEHGFLAFPSGSQFAGSFPAQIASSIFPVDVVATRLAFTTVPASVGLDEPFSISVTAVDESGNTDIHATNSVTISKNTGLGWLTVPNPTTSLQNGTATWWELRYFQAEPFTLLASTPALNNTVSTLIYCSDRTTTALTPSIPLEDATVSSLAVESSSAFGVLGFRISDPASTDGLPTYITQLAFKTFGLPTSTLLNRSIAGAILKRNEQPIVTESATITGDQITLTFAFGSLTVEDGETADFSLEVILNRGGLVNGSTLCLYIPSTDNGWAAAPNGSGFASTFASNVYGPVVVIEVVPTHISFSNQPIGVMPSPYNFSLTAIATDALGNVATDASATTSLALDYGAGTFETALNPVGLVNGKATWTNIMVENIGKYRFKAIAEFNQNVIGYSEEIWNGYATSCPIDDNFDLGYPLGFPTISAWGVSTVSPIDGAMSLKHMLSNVAGESSLEIPFNQSDVSIGTMEWSLVMRNGKWDPSADNAFGFVLMSDTISIRNGDYNGYAVGVNLSGTSDMLTLWKMNRGKSPQVLIQSNFDWDESETVQIKVTRTPTGLWSLWMQTRFGQNENRLAGIQTDNQYLVAKRCGPVFKFTSSRAGEFWVDNLKICQTSTPPSLQTVRAKSLTSVEVLFSKPVNQSDAGIPQNYTIKKSDGDPITILEALPSIENPRLVNLRTSTLPIEALRLLVRNIRDSQGFSVPDSLQFGIETFGAFGNVVFNEVMAKPDPAIELPAVEYIELYNRTPNPINLKNWKLKGNTSTVTIPERTIEPNGFILLCSTGSVGALSAYGTAVGLTSFPSLLNDGMFLGLYDADSRLMSWVEYSETWYGSDIKETGGYSLEKIDPNNLVEGKRNWIGSNDLSGGTPGRTNSTFAVNPDQLAPIVAEVKLISPTLVEVLYSETMDSLQIKLPANYTLSNGIGNPVSVVTQGHHYNMATLTLPSALVQGQAYTLCFSGQIIDFSGNTLAPYCHTIALHQQPYAQDVIINEVLFNPYAGGVDFVELFNQSDKIVDLNKLRIANRNQTALALNENYVASDTSRLLFPGDYVALSTDPEAIKRFYSVESDRTLIWLSKLPSYPNDNGYAVLLNESGSILDEFSYSEKMHLSLLADRKGVSLERINPSLPTNDASNWQSAAQTAGFATPGFKNSQYKEIAAPDEAFELVETVFSPDGDSFNDFLIINYHLPESGYLANIIVFDSQGRKVRRLVSNLSLGTSGTIKWDGATDSNQKAKLGAYVVFIEVFDLKGQVKHYKNTCVVAARFNR